MMEGLALRQQQKSQGCGYQGYEFGASYPDSVCIGGRLYDADHCDSDGNLYEPLDFVPCPMCDRAGAIEWWSRQNGTSNRNEARKQARALVADIIKNRRNGTEPWKRREQEAGQ